MAQLREILAYNLKKKRRICGFTQAQPAEKVNVSTHHIAMIEIARNYPTLELTERIVALNIEIYELFVAKPTPKDTMKQLHDTLAGNLEKVVNKAVKEAIAEQWKASGQEKPEAPQKKRKE